MGEILGVYVFAVVVLVLAVVMDLIVAACRYVYWSIVVIPEMLSIIHADRRIKRQARQHKRTMQARTDNWGDLAL